MSHNREALRVILVLICLGLVRCGAERPPTATTTETVTAKTNGPPEDALKFAFDHRQSGIIPTGKVLLFNHTTKTLYFFLFENDRWRHLFLNRGADVELPFESIWLAIGTDDAATPDLPNITFRPPKPGSESSTNGDYFVRLLHQRNRYEFCVNQTNQRWSVRELDEYPC